MDCLDPPAPEWHPPRHPPWGPGNSDGDTPKGFRLHFSPEPQFSDKQVLTQSCLSLTPPCPLQSCCSQPVGALLLAPFPGLACCPHHEGQHVPSAGKAGHLRKKPDPLQECLYFHLCLYFWCRRSQTRWSWGVPYNSAYSGILWLYFINSSLELGAHPGSCVSTVGQHYSIPVTVKPAEKITVCYCT